MANGLTHVVIYTPNSRNPQICELHKCFAIVFVLYWGLSGLRGAPNERMHWSDLDTSWTRLDVLNIREPHKSAVWECHGVGIDFQSLLFVFPSGHFMVGLKRRPNQAQNYTTLIVMGIIHNTTSPLPTTPPHPTTSPPHSTTHPAPPPHLHFLAILLHILRSCTMPQAAPRCSQDNVQSVSPGEFMHGHDASCICVLPFARHLLCLYLSSLHKHIISCIRRLIQQLADRGIFVE